MDHITHDEFAGRLEKIMEPLISRPSFKAKIAFFHGNVSSYNPYGTDRLHGAKLGVYENKVSDNVAEYLVPQESGNKCGVRYAKVVDKKGRGMMFFGDELSFSALPYTPHELENAAHHYELPPVHYTLVRIAKQQMGVAGDDSWGSHTHPEYLIDVSKKLEFTFCFKGI